jgi:hypothetical protein
MKDHARRFAIVFKPIARSGLDGFGSDRGETSAVRRDAASRYDERQAFFTHT